MSTADPLFILEFFSPLDNLFYYFCLINTSPKPDVTPTVSVVFSSHHTGGECRQAEPSPRFLVAGRQSPLFLRPSAGFHELL